jgi:rhodanese-related sulfurtransferase
MKLKIFTSMLLATIAFADDTSEAVTYLNQLRSGVGLVPYKASTLLSEAAKNHALYLKEENSFGHDETNSNNSHYAGEWIWDRATSVGYNYSSISENISMNNPDIKSSIDGLFVAIYHRLGFLSFDTENLGVGVEESSRYGMMYIYNMGTLQPRFSSDVRDLNPKIVKWPYPNYTKAQPAFFNTEFPAPLPECSTGAPSGNPISIQFNSAKSGDVVYESFSLTDKDANIVETKMVTDNLHDREFAFFPMSRLDWGSKYSVKFNYKEDGVNKSENWSFKTRELQHPIIKLDNTSKTYAVASGSTYSFYFVPDDCKDTSNGYSYDPSKIVFTQVDQNTNYIEVKASVGSDFSITLQNGKVYNFHTFTQEISDLSFSDVTKDSVTLNWTHTSSGEESGYKIYRDAELIATLDSDAKTYTDTNLDPTTTYNYTVKVTNDSKVTYAEGDFGDIDLDPSYTIPDGAYFVDIRDSWERDVYGGYAKGSVVVTYEFREEHAKDENEDRSKRAKNQNFVQEISDLVHGDKQARIILICATGGRTGAYGDRSEPSAAKLLADSGFRAVEHIKGGSFASDGWKDNNLPWISR